MRAARAHTPSLAPHRPCVRTGRLGAAFPFVTACRPLRRYSRRPVCVPGRDTLHQRFHLVQFSSSTAACSTSSGAQGEGRPTRCSPICSRQRPRVRWPTQSWPTTCSRRVSRHKFYNLFGSRSCDSSLHQAGFPRSRSLHVATKLQLLSLLQVAELYCVTRDDTRPVCGKRIRHG